MKKKILITQCLSVFAVVFLSGCASPYVNKTIGLSAKYPVVAPSQVEIVKRGKEIDKNLQIIGKVTVTGKIGVSPNKAKKYMKINAAEMGANGIIDFHRGMGGVWSLSGQHYSGIAVRWLAEGEPHVPLEKPFVIYRMPIKNPDEPGKYLMSKNTAFTGSSQEDGKWIRCAVFKGYHVLSTANTQYDIPIPELKKMSKTQLSEVGGPYAQILMGIGSETEYNWNVLEILSSAGSKVDVVFYDKQSRTELLKTQKTGSAAIGGLVFNLGMNQLNEAIGEALYAAAEELPSICEEL